MNRISRISKFAIPIGFLALSFACSTPNEATVRREFANRYPQSNVANSELIFEQDGVAVYLVTARVAENSEEGKYDFALKRSYVSWAWCDDQTDRKCK